MCLMALYLQVIIFPEQILEPEDRFFRFVHPSVQDMLRYFPTDTGGTDNQVFMIFFQQFLVDTRPSVETFRPGEGDHLDQILVPVQVLCQDYQVPAAPVVLRCQFAMPSVPGAVALTTEDRLEYLFSLFFDLCRYFFQEGLLFCAKFRFAFQLLQLFLISLDRI